MKTSISLFIRRIFPPNGAAMLTALCAGCLGNAYAVSVDDFIPRWFTNAQMVLPYRLFVPASYQNAGHYPLVLFLHGAGERGNDNWYQLVGQTGCLVFASEENQLAHPSFMVAPQCPADNSWTDSSLRTAVRGLMTALQTEFRVDTNRLYITGLSMGGYGTWDYIARYPGMYAAAVPMSGGGAISLASRMTQIPIWNFHAADDSVVSVSDSRFIVLWVRRAGGSVIYTEYASGGHVIWTPAYNTPGLMEWVYAQRLGATATNEPLLRIVSPTPQAIHYTGATNLDLAGSALAMGSDVTQVAWTNYANNAKGVAVGTNSWSIAGIPLTLNMTNPVVVVGTTTSWEPAYGGRTTFNDTLNVACYPIQATFAVQATNALLNWTGGGPPYRVQMATSLGDAAEWTDLFTNSLPPVLLPLPPAKDPGFYRIIGR